MSPAEASADPDPGGVLVAVAQFTPGPDRDQNLADIARLTRAAGSEGAEVVVFPEYSSYFESPLGPGLATAAEDLSGPFVRALIQLASDTGIHLVAGVVERSAHPSLVHNTVVAVAPAEGLVAFYRKVHLYDAFGASESTWMRAGGIEEPAVFDRGGLRFGLQTCYDLRFPEVSRRLVDAGADVLVVPAEWVPGPVKEHHWRTLLTARAIENTVYVLAADHAPPSGIGVSMIVDPLGVAKVELGADEGVAVAELRPSLIGRVREVNPALRLRRFAVVPAEDQGSGR